MTGPIRPRLTGLYRPSNLEQRLVSDLAQKAVGIARDAGAAATDAVEGRVADTLRAAVLDPAVAESLRAGRLVREHAAAGLPTDGAPSGTPRPKARRSGGAGAEQLGQAQRGLRDAQRTEQSARKRHESAGRQTARLRERAEEVLERLRAAEADQQAAADALAKAGEDRLRLAREAEELRRRAGA